MTLISRGVMHRYIMNPKQYIIRRLNDSKIILIRSYHGYRKLVTQKGVSKFFDRIMKDDPTRSLIQRDKSKRIQDTPANDPVKPKDIPATNNVLISAKLGLAKIRARLSKKKHIAKFCTLSYQKPNVVAVKIFNPDFKSGRSPIDPSFSEFTLKHMIYYRQKPVVEKPRILKKEARKDQIGFNKIPLELSPLQCSRLINTYGSVLSAVFAMR
ncbi:hypothetical protein RF11_08258 [Thelohanellus kitauei]|uniref:Uncharacterized protein n=1 Tax=Thelohanellus kitauei TaxID=669202 RepID=A0A0C2JB95_THEKT|nr:hypothetical protein RF11_08258 [Thelohanellus kitauei]